MAHVFFILPKFQSSKIYIFLPSLVKKSRFTTKNRNLGRARVKSSFYTSGFKGGTILVAFWRKTGQFFGTAFERVVRRERGKYAKFRIIHVILIRVRAAWDMR